MINITQYVKNVTKSAGYILFDTVKDLNPSLSEFYENNNQVIKDVVSQAKNIKKILRDGRDSIADNEYSIVARDTVHNFLDDLKTGKFYNKDRKEDYDKQAMEAMGFSLDDWDMSSPVDENHGEGSPTPNEIVDQNMLTADKMDAIGQKISQATGRASIGSADYIVKSSRATFNKLFAQNEKLFAGLNNNIAGLNNNLSVVGKNIIDPLNKHIVNSAKFYQVMTEQTSKQTALLENINNLLTERYGEKKKDKKVSKLGYDDIVGSNGTLRIEAYVDLVKANFASMTELITGMASMMGPGMVRSSLHSPVASLLKTGLSSFGKKLFGKELESLNRTFSSSFGQIMQNLRLKGRRDGGIWALVNDLFGIKAPGKKSSIDPSKYQKGRTDWTGKDSKALQEVIPMYLARMEAILSGSNDVKIFNYDSGKWTTISEIKKDLETREKRVASSATYDIREALEQAFLKDGETQKTINRGGHGLGSRGFKNISSDIESFYYWLSVQSRPVPRNEREWKNLYNTLNSNGGMWWKDKSPNAGAMYKSNFSKIKALHKRLEQQNRGALMGASTMVEQGRRDINNMYSRMESENGVATHLYNNSNNDDKRFPELNPLNSVKDNKGNNVFFYLQGIYDGILKLNGSTSGLNSAPRGHNNNSQSSSSIIIPDTVNRNSERQRRNNSNQSRDRQNSREDRSNNSSQRNNRRNNQEEDKKNKYKEYLQQLPMFSRMGAVGDMLASVLATPAESIRGAIESADKAIFNLVFGRNKDGSENDNGILDAIKKGFEETFETIKTGAKKMFDSYIKPLFAAIGDNIAKLFGEKSFKGLTKGLWKGIKNSKFGEGFVDTFKDAGNYVKDSFGGVFGSVKSFFGGKDSNTASRGGFVTKSGMVSVSEGEMIIPGNMNPFYDKKYNASKNLARERYTANRWLGMGGDPDSYFGEYAKGGKVKNNNKGKGSNNNNPNKRRRGRGKGKKGKDFDVRKTEVYKNADEFISDMMSEAKDTFNNVMGSLFGNLGSTDEERKSQVQDALKPVVSELKVNAGPAVAGLLMGGGLGLMSGIVGGPIIGAALGAAIVMNKKSNKFSEFLFGNEEAGKKGLFSKRIGTFLKEHAPGIAKFATVGGIAGFTGIIPGGPLGGILLGSAIGFATENEKFKNYLFGDTGLLGKDTDKKIKKSLPKMALGAAALSFTGPFGLLGNIALGGALGFVSDSQKFKELIFGVEDSNGVRKGGILGSVRKRIIDPLADYISKGLGKVEDMLYTHILEPIKNIFSPIGDFVKGTVTSIGDFVKGLFKDKVVQPLWRVFDRGLQWLLKPVKGVWNKAIGAVGGVVKMFGNTLNAGATFLNRGNIKRGVATSMSAEERAAFVKGDKTLKDKDYAFRAYDEAAAGMTSEDLSTHLANLTQYKSVVQDQGKNKTKILQDAYNRLLVDADLETTMGQDRTLRKLFNKSKASGDLSGVMSYVDSLNAQGKFKNYDKVSEKLKQSQSEFDKINNEDYSGITSNAKESLKALGLTEDMLKSSNLFNLIRSDISKKGNKSSKNPDTSGDASNNTNEMDDTNPTAIVDQIKETRRDITTPLNTIVSLVAKIAGVDIPDSALVDKTGSNDIARDTIKDVTSAITDANKKEESKKVSLVKGVNLKKPGSKDNTNENKEPKEETTKTEVDSEGNILTMIKDRFGNWRHDLRDAGTKHALAAKKKFGELQKKLYATFPAIGDSLSKLGNFFGFGKKGKNGEEKEKKKGGLLGGLLGFVGNLASGASGLLGGALSNLMPILLGGAGLMLAPKILPMVQDFLNSDTGKKLKEGIADGFKLLIQTVIQWIKDIMPKDFDGWKKLFLGDDDGKDTDGDGKPDKKKGIFDYVHDGAESIENFFINKKTREYGPDEYEQSSIADRFWSHGFLKNSIIKGGTGNKLLELVPLIGKPANNILKWTGKARNAIVKKSKGLGGKIYAGLKEQGGKLLDKGKNYVDDVYKRASKYGGKLIDKGKNFADDVYKRASKYGGELLEKGRGYIDNAVETAGKYGGIIADKGRGYIDNAVSALGKTNVGQKVINATTNMAGKVRSVGSNLLEKAGGYVDNLVTAASKSTAAQNVMKTASNLRSGVSDVVKKYGGKIGEKVGNIAANIASKVQGIFTKLLSMFGIKEGGEKVVKEASEAVGKSVAKEGGEKAAKGMLGMTPIQLVFVGLALENGFEDAKAILGIIDEPTFLERVLAAAINGINEAIPGIGGIIPTEYFVNLLLPIFKAIGINVEELEQKRAAAKAIVEEWNAANPDKTYTVREYIKNVLGEKTTQEKVMDFGGKVLKGAGKALAPVGKAIGTAAGTAFEVVKTGMKGTADFITGVSQGKLFDAENYKQTFDIGINTIPEILGLVVKGDPLALIKYMPKVDLAENPVGIIPVVMANTLKLPLMLPTIVSWAGHKVWDVFDKYVIKPGAEALAETINVPISYGKFLYNGDVEGAWNYMPNIDITENLFGILPHTVNILAKSSMLIPTAISWVSWRIRDGILSFIQNGKDAIIACGLTFKDTDSLARDGDVSGLWNYSPQIADDNYLKFLPNIVSIVQKVTLTIPAGIIWLGKKIGGWFVAKTSMSPTLISDIMEYKDPYKHKDTKGVDKLIEKSKSDGDGPMDKINNFMVSVIGGITKMIVKIMRPFMKIAKPVQDAIKTANDFIFGKDDKGNTTVTVTTSNSDNEESSTSSTNSEESSTEESSTSSSNSNDTNDQTTSDALAMKMAGTGSGAHVSQRNNRIANKKFGKSSIYENGCGPAAAATVLKSYGKNADIGYSANYAVANGYVAGSSGVGTRATYFGDILGANGISSTYSTSQKAIANSIRGGNSTILLGQDSGNRDKGVSPFGPRPHYVVAHGMDKRGNVIVDDPELNGTTVYDKSILNKTKLGVMTGGGIFGRRTGKTVNVKPSGTKYRPSQEAINSAREKLNNVSNSVLTGTMGSTNSSLSGIPVYTDKGDQYTSVDKVDPAVGYRYRSAYKEGGKVKYHNYERAKSLKDFPDTWRSTFRMGASHGVSVSDPDYKFTTTRTKDGNIPWFIYKKSPKVTGDASSTTGSSGESGGEDGSTSIGDYSGEAVNAGEIDYVGKYVQKFESGDRGSSMISSGKGDAGGASFGLFQFPSYGKSDTGANSLLGQMWANYKDKYPATPGDNSAFKDAWAKASVAEQPEFLNNERLVELKNDVQPVIDSLQKSFGDTMNTDRALQELIWSSGVHYGPGGKTNKAFAAAGINTLEDYKKNPSESIKKIYQAKLNNVSANFPSSSESVRKGIRERFQEEGALVSGLTNLPPIDISKIINGGSAAGGEGGTQGAPSSSGNVLTDFFNKAFGMYIQGMGKYGKLFSTPDVGNDGGESSNSGPVAGSSTGKGGPEGQKAVELIKSIYGKNNYTRKGARENVFDTIDKGAKMGAGDCSSTARKVIERATGKNIGGFTGDQYGGYAKRGGIIVNSGAIDESKLAPGDLLYYKRHSPSSDRPDGVGHVEMYVGDGKRAGHGGGVGPKESPLSSDSARFLKAIRFTDVSSGTNTSTTNSATNANKLTGTGSGLKPINLDKYYGGDSGINISKSVKGISKPVLMNNIDSARDRVIINNSGDSNLKEMLDWLKLIAANTSNNAALQTIAKAVITILKYMDPSNIDETEEKNRLREEAQSMVDKLTALASSL